MSAETPTPLPTWQIRAGTVLFYLVPISAGLLCLAPMIGEEMSRELGIGLADVALIPLQNWRGIVLLPLILAFAFRRTWIMAAVSLGAIGAWFLFCFLAVSLGWR